MRATPDWLPELASAAGDLQAVVGRLYGIFHRDVKQGNLVLRGTELWWDQRPTEVFGFTFEEGFWHLVSRDYYIWTTSGREKKRDFDPLRAERLPWFAPTVRHADSGDVRLWDYMEADGKLHVYVWLAEWDYVIVLEPRGFRIGKVYFLASAYHVDGPGTRAKLQRKYEKRIA